MNRFCEVKQGLSTNWLFGVRKDSGFFAFVFDEHLKRAASAGSGNPKAA
jgi:hypothetical protein